MQVANKSEKIVDLRSPICCILGHVDTGKTKLLDNIRKTNIQDGEAGGITQQIGATYFPIDAIRDKTQHLNQQWGNKVEYKIPGLLIMDTPGHESFSNLRSRGSSLCDIAILVIDLMHGLKPQTIESLNLLKHGKIPFIIALNKIDLCFGWKPTINATFKETFENQDESVHSEFESRAKDIMLQLSEQGLNSCLYYKNKDFRYTVSIVPTSARTGEGVPDLLLLMTQLCQRMMSEKLTYISELQCTILEVKVVEGLGTVIDVILSNGVLNEGDKIVLCGFNGPIVTNIRALLTPQPMREIRVKSEYIHHKTVKASQGIRIFAPELEQAIAGSSILVCEKDEDLEKLKVEVMTEFNSILKTVDSSSRGVSVQASTIGSMEALLEFLQVSKIPVSNVNIGPIHRKDVVRASVMLEHKKEFGVILAFNVKVEPDAQKLADEVGVKIFTAEVIYHLLTTYTGYTHQLLEEKRSLIQDVNFPCHLKIIPNNIYARKEPIIVGVNVLDGILRVGTVLVAKVENEYIEIGKVSSIENNHKSVDKVRKGVSVAIKIVPRQGHMAVTYGRQFDMTHEIYSYMNRDMIDILKENYKDELSKEDWKLVIGLKKVFNIL